MRFTEPEFLRYLLRLHQFPEPVLEVGAGWTPDFHRTPFTAAGYKHCLSHDQQQYPNAPTLDMVSDICALPVEPQSVGTLLCFNVLEHVPAPWNAIKELQRVLKQGGWLIGSVPMRCAIHRHSRDYWRFCPDGVAELLRGFRLECFTVEGNPQIPANLLFAAVNDAERSDWLAHNEAIIAKPLLITETDYYTENRFKQAVVRFVRKFGYDMGLWTNTDDRPRMRELGYLDWKTVPKGLEWPRD